MKFNHVTPSKVLEEISAVTTDNGRYYLSPSGKHLPSVTTVTGWKKSKFFAKWRRDNPKEARRVTARGNEFHALIERYLYNNLTLSDECLDIHHDLLFLFNQLKPELDKINNIRGLETGLWSDKVGLAGRADCVAEYDGELSIIDFKGSTRAKRARDIENYYLQATAYALMWQDNYGEEIPSFRILISCEDGISQVFGGRTMDYTKKLHETIREYHEEHSNLFSQL
jgi:genome maintenance exonuclease 1